MPFIIVGLSVLYARVSIYFPYTGERVITTVRLRIWELGYRRGMP
jgi:hypothetical protein